MKRALIAAWITAALSSIAGPASAVTTLHRLVYSFAYGSQQTISARDSNTAAEEPDPAARSGSGITNYHGVLGDKGTMTVDILRRQPDGGVIVSISEQGEQTRSAPPATCVAYSDTRVICDPNKTVLPEEFTLLRFLGANFVDPSQLDADRHWSVTQNGKASSVKADYRINSNNGGLMQISENRLIRPNGGGSETTDVQTKIKYDSSRSIPTSVDEYVRQYQDNGVTGTTTTIYQTTLKLVSGSTTKT